MHVKKTKTIIKHNIHITIKSSQFIFIVNHHIIHYILLAPMRCYAPKQNFQINLHFTTFFHLHHFSNMVYNRNQQGMYQNLIQVHKIKKSVTDLFSKTKS